jgi:hypothetical protein
MSRRGFQDGTGAAASAARAVALAAASLCLLTPAAGAATFTVTNTADSGPGSLRQAVADANSTGEPDAVAFAIGSGPQTISLASTLEVSQPLHLDGTTQPSYAGSPLVRVVGPPEGDGILVSGDESTIRAVAVTDAGEAGIAIEGDDNRVVASYVGLDPSGAAAPNGIGILVGPSYANVVGGAPGEGNVVSGNLGAGLVVEGAGSGEERTRVVGNRIGVAPSGAPAPNGGDGVFVDACCDVEIGGAGTGEGNRIAHNGGDGIELVSGDVAIRRNSIAENGGLGIRGASLPSAPTVVVDGQVSRISGSAPGPGPVRVDVFANDRCDPDSSESAFGRFGEGDALLASAVAEGGSYDVRLDRLLASGTAVTVTITDAHDSTTGFSYCRVHLHSHVWLEPGRMRVLEGEEFRVAAVRSGFLGTDLIATLQLQGESATAFSDFFPSASAWIRTNLTRDEIRVVTRRDSVVEPDETLILRLVPLRPRSTSAPATILAAPHEMRLTIVDAPPSPPPSEPDSYIRPLPSALRADRLRRFVGHAYDADRDLARVEVAVVKVGGAARAAARRRPSCRVLRADGRMALVRARRGRCRPVFLRASGTSRWTYALKRPLSPGRYVVYSRAVDRSGRRETAFGRGDGNRRTFRLVPRVRRR